MNVKWGLFQGNIIREGFAKKGKDLMKIKRKFIIAMACIVSLVMCNVLDFANVNLESYANAATFQITYNANGGVNPPEPQRDIVDDTVVLLKDKEGITKPGFKFDG